VCCYYNFGETPDTFSTLLNDNSVDIDKTPLEDYENAGMDDYNGEKDDECEEIEEGVFDGTQPGCCQREPPTTQLRKM
jgi:hypothetical protein